MKHSLVLEDRAYPVLKWRLMQLGLFSANPSLFQQPSYAVKSRVSHADFKTFIDAIGNETVQVTKDNAVGLRSLCTEFLYSEIDAALDAILESGLSTTDLRVYDLQRENKRYAKVLIDLSSGFQSLSSDIMKKMGSMADRLDSLEGSVVTLTKRLDRMHALSKKIDSVSSHVEKVEKDVSNSVRKVEWKVCSASVEDADQSRFVKRNMCHTDASHKIFECTDTLSKIPGVVGVKVYGRNASDYLSSAVAIHRSLDHPAIIKLLAVCQGEAGLEVVMPLMPYSLEQVSKSEFAGSPVAGWNATAKSKVIFGIVYAMLYLHSRNYVHYGLTTESVFLDKNLEPKLDGFDQTTVAEGGYRDDLCLPPIYMAPEDIMDESRTNVDQKSDVFAFAVFVRLLFSLDLEFDGRLRHPTNTFRVFKCVTQGDRLIRPDSCPDRLWELIKECWDSEPGMRPSFANIAEVMSENIAEYTPPDTDFLSLREYINRISH